MNAENLNNDPSRQTAIANLHMLLQYSTGQATPKKADDPQQRYSRVLSYLMTGQCLVDPEVQSLVEAVNGALRQLPVPA